jgi:hypothetical protein
MRFQLEFTLLGLFLFAPALVWGNQDICAKIFPRLTYSEADPAPTKSLARQQLVHDLNKDVELRRDSSAEAELRRYQHQTSIFQSMAQWMDLHRDQISFVEQPSERIIQFGKQSESNVQNSQLAQMIHLLDKHANTRVEVNTIRLIMNNDAQGLFFRGRGQPNRILTSEYDMLYLRAGATLRHEATHAYFEQLKSLNLRTPYSGTSSIGGNAEVPIYMQDGFGTSYSKDEVIAHAVSGLTMILELRSDSPFIDAQPAGAAIYFGRIKNIFNLLRATQEMIEFSLKHSPTTAESADRFRQEQQILLGDIENFLNSQAVTIQKMNAFSEQKKLQPEISYSEWQSPAETKELISVLETLSPRLQQALYPMFSYENPAGVEITAAQAEGLETLVHLILSGDFQPMPLSPMVKP